ncbi:MAG: DUF3990 domain-containing protein [Butyrivibrio sp.]|uniref:DUF3990 domain-containing protein n=1 Tax=Butyrivibrio sp. TaxID=28121 RepID=UPI002FE6E28A|nr:DUF3990 domain-containing protein [Butyrivibrio sp.]
MRVYHGSVEIVKTPDVLHSYRPLDFGKGFYVTTVKEQAEKLHMFLFMRYEYGR